jgi:hypothetical protein
METKGSVSKWKKRTHGNEEQKDKESDEKEELRDKRMITVRCHYLLLWESVHVSDRPRPKKKKNIKSGGIRTPPCLLLLKNCKFSPGVRPGGLCETKKRL